MARVVVKGLDHIGFTGTQTGLTEQQTKTLTRLLRQYRDELGRYQEFNHGDCIGADAQAHELALAFGYSVIIHPPINSTKRAFCQNWDRLDMAKPYLDRNRDIANQCDLLIACPKESSEVLRSGTWATLRYARRRGRKAIIIRPDGIICQEPASTW